MIVVKDVADVAVVMMVVTSDYGQWYCWCCCSHNGGHQ